MKCTTTFSVVLLVLLSLASLCLAAFSLSSGSQSCSGGSRVEIHSSSQNTKAAAYLASVGQRVAGLPGYVDNGILGWVSGADMDWQPVSVPSAGSGFLALRQDGSWSVQPYGTYRTSLFLCSDGKDDDDGPEEPTTTTTTTTSTAPTATPTEAPEDTAPSLEDVLARVHQTLSARGAEKLVVAAATTNALSYRVPASLARDVSRLPESGAYISVGLGCSAESATVLAKLNASTANTLQFLVPYSILALKADETFNLCLVGEHVTSAAPAAVRGLPASLTVVTTTSLLTQLRVSVDVNEDLVQDGLDHVLRVPLAGAAGTLAPNTTRLSPDALGMLSLSMVNNGVAGSTCVPSSNTIGYFVSRASLNVVMKAEYLSKLKQGKKSICAVVGSQRLNVGSFAMKAFSSSAPADSYAFGTDIPVMVDGISNTALAKGRYTAFLSSSADCSKKTDASSARLLVNAGLVPHLFVTVAAPADTSKTRYLCLEHTPSSTKVRVLSTASGKTVTLSSTAAGDALSDAVPRLTVLQGMMGNIRLADYVARPATSTASSSTPDEQAYLRAQNIMRGGATVSFVPLPLTGATASEKSLSCGTDTLSDFTQALNNGVLHIATPVVLRSTEGIVCAEGTYLRIDYRVLDPAALINALGNDEDFDGSTFVLSAGQTDATTVALAAPLSSYGDMALRFSPDDTCSGGAVALLRPYVGPVGGGNTISTAVASYSTVIKGTYSLCVGIYGSVTGAFVPTGATLTFLPYSTALAEWKRSVGAVPGVAWRPCGALAACGQTQPVAYSRVCSAPLAANRFTWPMRLHDELNYLGAIDVSLDGPAAASTAAASFDGDVYVQRSAALAHCQDFTRLVVSSDNATFGALAVGTAQQPFLLFDPVVDVTGVVFALIPHDYSCAAAATDKKAFRTSYIAGDVAVDVSSLVPSAGHGSAAFTLCYRAGETWHDVRGTHIELASQLSPARVEGVVTAAAAESLQLWSTESATWQVAGLFPNGGGSSAAASSEAPAVLSLVYDDATCVDPAAEVAYTTHVSPLSPTSGTAEIEVAEFRLATTGEVAAGSAAQRRLYVCDGAGALTRGKPLLATYANSYATVRALSLSTLSHLPSYALGRTAPDDVTVELTDALAPPVRLLALFSGDAAAATGCDTTSHAFLMSLRVTPSAPDDDSAATTATVTVPAQLAEQLGRAGVRRVSLCATASRAPNPTFVPVAAALSIEDVGTNPRAPVLLLSLTPLNASSDVVSLEAARAPLAAHAKTNGGLGDDVVITEVRANVFLLYTPTDSVAALYSSLIAGTGLPLYVTEGESFYVLSAVEGVRLGDLSSLSDYPRTAVVSEPQGVKVNTSRLGIALFCIVVAPTAIGFVAFSVQRTIPTLSHAKLGKEKPIIVPSGDSPPPRNPRPALNRYDSPDKAGAGRPAADGDSTAVGVAARTEDTAANPLYGSGDDDDYDPPLTNATFAGPTGDGKDKENGSP